MTFLVKVNNLLIRRPSIFVYKYLKQLSFDYRDALIDTGKKIVQHPIKAIFYTSNVSVLVYAYKTMPSLNSYRHDLVQFRHQQLLTSSLIRNKKIETYIDTIEQLLTSEQIHFVDCYLFSLIIYKNQHHTDGFSYRLYDNICSYLHLKRNARIIDIGAFNRWFILKRQLRKADIFDDINNEKNAL
jgi:hypothetical protein